MALVNVSTGVVLRGPFRKAAAWDKIRDFASYPRIMENVDEVRVHEQNETEGRSEWFVTVEEAPLTWIERDYFDREHHAIRFESIHGDFEKFNGNWSVCDHEGQGIKIDFSVEYDLGIPVIEEVLGRILKEKMKSNFDSMIEAIRDDLEKAAFEERSEDRVAVGKTVEMRAGGRSSKVRLLNVSRGGMMIRAEEPVVLSSLEERIELCDVTIEGSSVVMEHRSDAIRVVFGSPLGDTDYAHLMATLCESPAILSDMVKIYEVVTAPKVQPAVARSNG